MSLCAQCGAEHEPGACTSGTISWDDPTEIGITPATSLRAGIKVGEYVLTERIGEGGMGVVWAGEHPLIGRKVAVKIVHATSTSIAARFLKEAQAASRLRHRNIVDVFGFGQLPDGRSYLVMEFLSGSSLAGHLARRGPIGWDEAWPILDGILAALKVAHEGGVVHRDLKPDNVWLAPPDGGAGDAQVVKLLDFGLAKVAQKASDSRDALMTRAGVPMGTPAYMSPEQCRGAADVDARSDLYSLGVMLFQMFAGRVPFEGQSYIDVIARHLSDDVPPLAAEVALPEPLDRVIARATAKLASERYQSADELRAALAAAAAPGWIPSDGGGPGGPTLVPPTLVPSAARGRTIQSPGPPPAALRTRLESQPEWVAPPPRAIPPRGSTLPPRPGTTPPPATSGPPRETAPARRPPPARALPPSELRRLLYEPALIEGLTLQPDLAGDTATLTLQGDLDGDAAVPALADALAGLLPALREHARRVILDVTDVHFLDPGALECLAGLLSELAAWREEGFHPATVRYSASVGWQRTMAQAFARADPALMLEAADA